MRLLLPGCLELVNRSCVDSVAAVDHTHHLLDTLVLDLDLSIVFVRVILLSLPILQIPSCSLSILLSISRFSLFVALFGEHMNFSYFYTCVIMIIY